MFAYMHVVLVIIIYYVYTVSTYKVYIHAIFNTKFFVYFNKIWPTFVTDGLVLPFPGRVFWLEPFPSHFQEGTVRYKKTQCDLKMTFKNLYLYVYMCSMYVCMHVCMYLMYSKWCEKTFRVIGFNYWRYYQTHWLFPNDSKEKCDAILEGSLMLTYTT